MIRNVAVLALGLLLTLGSATRAQEAISAQSLSAGMHAYYSGDMQKAYETLSMAIGAGTQDPRCYYFRGLAFLRTGREDEAKADFQQGASIESTERGRAFNVAKSLERIQGRERMLLEEYRASARMATLQRDEAQRRARYEAIRQEQNQMLQRQAEQVPAPPAKPAAASPADAFETGPMPAAKPAAEGAPAADAAMPAEPAAKPAASDDPFSTPPAKPAAKPAEDDPFMAPPAAKPAAAKPAAKPAEDDPFATPPAKPAAPAAKPTAKPAAKPAAKAAPADEDPFAPAKPAAKQ